MGAQVSVCRYVSKCVCVCVCVKRVKRRYGPNVCRFRRKPSTRYAEYVPRATKRNAAIAKSLCLVR